MSLEILTRICTCVCIFVVSFIFSATVIFKVTTYLRLFRVPEIEHKYVAGNGIIIDSGAAVYIDNPVGQYIPIPELLNVVAAAA